MKGLRLARLGAAPAPSQQGLGLVTAIFVITVAAGLVVGMASLVVNQQQSYAHALLTTRAQLAAESALEVGWQTLRPVTGAITEATEATAIQACAPRSAPVLPDQSFASCQLTLRCQALQAASGRVFVLKAEARCGAGADTAVGLVQRVVRP